MLFRNRGRRWARGRGRSVGNVFDRAVHLTMEITPDAVRFIDLKDDGGHVAEHSFVLTNQHRRLCFRYIHSGYVRQFCRIVTGSSGGPASLRSTVVPPAEPPAAVLAGGWSPLPPYLLPLVLPRWSIWRGCRWLAWSGWAWPSPSLASDSLSLFRGVFRSKTEVRKTTLFQKIAKNSKMSPLDFKYPYPLAIVWMCVWKKTRRFYHNYEEFGRPGLRINKDTVEAMIAAVTDTAAAVDWNTATVVLQLFDNSVYLVSTPGGEKHLPRRDRHGSYHIDGDLTVADKSAVKNLVMQLTPLFKVLEPSRKIVLTPLARYWVGPCCSDVSHHTNYKTSAYLPSLGDAVHALRDNIRDSLYTKHVQNFRVLCPNRMVGVGQRSQVPSDEEAARTAALWGADPVHPSAAAYRCTVSAIKSARSRKNMRFFASAADLTNITLYCWDFAGSCTDIRCIEKKIKIHSNGLSKSYISIQC